MPPCKKLSFKLACRESSNSISFLIENSERMLNKSRALVEEAFSKNPAVTYQIRSLVFRAVPDRCRFNSNIPPTAALEY